MGVFFHVGAQASTPVALTDNPYTLNPKFPITMNDSQYYYGQNCTYWAWERAHQVCGTRADFFADHWGNAGTWPAYANSEGKTVSGTPLLNSVAVIAANSTYRYGHVAWVEAINGDNVTVSQMDYFGSMPAPTATYPASKFTGGFIQVDGCSMPLLPTSNDITISGDLVVGANINIVSWLTNNNQNSMAFGTVVISVHRANERENPVREYTENNVTIPSNGVYKLVWNNAVINTPGVYDVVVKVKTGSSYPEIISKSITISAATSTSQGSSTYSTGANYANNLDVEKILTVPGARIIKVAITGRTEQSYDWLAICEGTSSTCNENVNTRLLTGTINETLMFSGSSVKIHFHSDYSVNDTGVTVTVTPDNNSSSTSSLTEEQKGEKILDCLESLLPSVFTPHQSSQQFPQSDNRVAYIRQYNTYSQAVWNGNWWIAKDGNWRLHDTIENMKSKYCNTAW
jgi:surface antigen